MMKLFAFKQVLLRPVDKIKHRIWFTGALTFCTNASPFHSIFVGTFFRPTCQLQHQQLASMLVVQARAEPAERNVQEQLMLTA